MKISAKELKVGMKIKVASFHKRGCIINIGTSDGGINPGIFTKKSPLLTVYEIQNGRDEGFANGGAGKWTFVPTFILTTENGRLTINARQKVELISE